MQLTWSKNETQDIQYTCHFIKWRGAKSGDVNYCRSLTALQLMTAHRVTTLMMPCSTPIHVPAAELVHVAASLTLTRGLTQRSHHTSNIALVHSGGTCSVHYICYYVSTKCWNKQYLIELHIVNHWIRPRPWDGEMDKLSQSYRKNIIGILEGCQVSINK